MFEYGSRAGVWRLLRIFDKHGVKSTFFACAVALEKNPAVARAITAGGHDVLGHGDRWQEHFLLDREAERAAIDRAVASITRTTGQAPAGWYCRYGPSVNTRELVVASGHFLYDSDAYNDDLPYYTRVNGRPWLVVPYALDTNDIRFWRGGLNHGEDFFRYLRDAFDDALRGRRDVPAHDVGGPALPDRRPPCPRPAASTASSPKVRTIPRRLVRPPQRDCPLVARPRAPALAGS